MSEETNPPSDRLAEALGNDGEQPAQPVDRITQLMQLISQLQDDETAFRQDYMAKHGSEFADPGYNKTFMDAMWKLSVAASRFYTPRLKYQAELDALLNASETGENSSANVTIN